MSKYVLSGACWMLLVGSGVALAADPEPALDGYCPVCLVRMGELVKGDAKFSSVFDGQTYLFPEAKQKRMFDADPAAFAPALGGQCTVCKVEKGKRVLGKAEFHTVRDGRLYLFPGEKQQKMFARDPDRYVDADLALGGACPVCLVKMNKVVAGEPQYASVHDGLRYLFPAERQRQMFDADPAAFTPAMGGKCTVCKVEMNKDVAGQAEYHLTHNGRLYLFPSQEQLDAFKAKPARYADADVAMDGYCAVCKVEMGQDIKGKSDFAVDYNGKRYLFPGAKQLDMFKGNPVKYAVQ